MYKIFIVFHKYIFDECYKNVPDEILNKHFVFIAVNPAIKKEYTQNKYNVINEWELPNFNKNLDNNILRENTAIYHVFANNLHKDCDYIGFAQYDMMFNLDSFKNIDKLSLKSYLACISEPMRAMKYSNDANQLVDYMIQSYINFFGNINIQENTLYPLLNTYIISTSLFEKIMSWVISTYDTFIPECLKYSSCQGENQYYIAGFYERMMALAIAAENLESFKFNITHDHNFKNLSY